MVGLPNAAVRCVDLFALVRCVQGRWQVLVRAAKHSPPGPIEL